ncbi:hypothetical protein GIB67_025882 [Kingdonia uniflora]|uniref:Uncharacterized protein n=1 Tax=Kingdonia uniflora TaxID=39325 RepID=A0A7J7LXF1_9MAGN|nr:hypothetical protein GIB67_025882 [Kingdonia uniflora]
MSLIGWYGPLIHLSQASSHMGHYVQLLVFVHRTRPIQKFKSVIKGALLKTDIQVGDDTLFYFSVSIWQKEMGSMVVAGDVVLLQNVKIVTFGDVVEAGTVQYSSLKVLVHPYELLMSKDVDGLLACSRTGETTKKKLKRVVEWVQRSGATLHSVQLQTSEKRQILKNWKVHEERKTQDCISILEVSCLTSSGKAAFYGSVGEMFLHSIWETKGELDKERMFITRRLYMIGDTKIAEDLICTGCKLCDCSLELKHGSLLEEMAIPLYCSKNSNRLHTVCLIYRPFLLYVWDQSECIPLLVTNKVAELLFGNITAEKVYLCYKGENEDQGQTAKDVQSDQRANAHTTATRGEEVVGSRSSNEEMNLDTASSKQVEMKKRPNFYKIWLILLKMMLKQEKNSPLRFEVNVNTDLNPENGRFELISLTMPYFLPNQD